MSDAKPEPEMRSFYVLGLDPSRDDLQAVVDADLAGFNHTELTRGRRAVALPPDLRLFVSGEKQAHALGNAFGWKVLSAQAVEVVCGFVPGDELQILDLAVLDARPHAPVGGYFLVNCLRLVPAMGCAAGDQMIYAHRVVIKESSVPPDVHLFRLAEEPFHWVASEHCWKRLAALDGFDATAIQTIP
jgi:hypothetical protein